MCQIAYFTKGTHMFDTWLTHVLCHSSLVLCVLVPILYTANAAIMQLVPHLTHARPRFDTCPSHFSKSGYLKPYICASYEKFFDILDIYLPAPPKIRPAGQWRKLD